MCLGNGREVGKRKQQRPQNKIFQSKSKQKERRAAPVTAQVFERPGYQQRNEHGTSPWKAPRDLGKEGLKPLLIKKGSQKEPCSSQLLRSQTTRKKSEAEQDTKAKQGSLHKHPQSITTARVPKKITSKRNKKSGNPRPNSQQQTA